MKVTIPYTPRPLQNIIHSRLQRFNVIVCHRRFGKTIFCINEMIRKALTNTKKRPQYAYIAPDLKQAKKVAWDALKEYTRGIPGVKYNESELLCTLPNQAKLFLLGAENFDSIRGMYLDGVILDEVGQMSPEIWGSVVRPTLSDRKGWAIFIGTPKGQNFFYDIYEKAKKMRGWYTALYRASQTKIIDDEEMASLKAEQSEDEFEQEYECSFTAAVRGTYFAKLLTDAELEGRIKNIGWESSEPVYTAWDLGINDKTSIWFFQNIVGEIRIIDYYENDGEALTHYVNVVKSKGYVYEHHILPHDAMQRSYSTGKTRLDQFRKLGLKCRVAPRTSVQEGISAAKAMIPKCFFDKTKCELGLIALRNYRSEYNDKLGTFLSTPRHDQFSHASDAFRYMAVGMVNPISKMQRSLMRKHLGQVQEYDPYNF